MENLDLQALRLALNLKLLELRPRLCIAFHQVAQNVNVLLLATSHTLDLSNAPIQPALLQVFYD